MRNRIPTPLRSVRKYCLACMLGSATEVKLCPSTDCLLYKFRLGKGRVSVKLIKKFCYGCGEGTYLDTKNCDHTECPLHAYRMGKSPNRVGGYRGTAEALRKWHQTRHETPKQGILIDGVRS